MSITIKRARKVVDLCVNMDQQAAWEAAVKDLEEAKKRASRDARETDATVSDCAARVVEIEQEMLAHTVRFTLEAMPKKKWAEHVAAHPARDGDEIDAALGVDVSSLDDAIAAMILDVTTPAGEPLQFAPADWPALADEMSNPQWEEFAQAALALNQGAAGGQRVPFSRVASLEMRRSEQTSKQPND